MFACQDELVFALTIDARAAGAKLYRVLEFAVARHPMRHRDLVATQQTRQTPPKPPKRVRLHLLGTP